MEREGEMDLKLSRPQEKLKTCGERFVSCFYLLDFTQFRGRISGKGAKREIERGMGRRWVGRYWWWWWIGVLET